MVSIIWAVAVVLLILWLLGFAFHVAGGLVHILIVLAIIAVLYNLFVGRRRSI